MEDLLIWSYRDQMVHGARPENEPAELAKVFSTGYASMKLAPGGASGGNCGYEADPDAFAVARAVGELPGEVTVRIAPPPRVDRLGVARDEAMIWPCAFAVSPPKIVMAAAMDGERPDWMPEGPGRLKDAKTTIWARTSNGTVKRHRVTGEQIGLICVLKIEGAMPWEVERARAVYGVWWDALARLRESLAGNVRRFEVTAQMPPREPWNRA